MKKRFLFCSILMASVLAGSPVMAAGAAVTSAIKEAEKSIESASEASAG